MDFFESEAEVSEDEAGGHKASSDEEEEEEGKKRDVMSLINMLWIFLYIKQMSK